MAFFDADTLCHAVTLTFDLLTLNFYGTSIIMCLESVQNLCEIPGWVIQLSSYVYAVQF